MSEQHLRVLFFFQKGNNFTIDFSFNITNTPQIIFDFLNMINAKFNSEKQIIEIPYKIKKDKKFIDKLNSFINKYKHTLPSIQKLNKILKNVEDNKYFFILPDVEMDTKIKYLLEKELIELNNEQFLYDEEIIKPLLDEYDIISFNINQSKKIKIGESVKNKRVCRFCGKSQPETTFNKIAHAISEALGNKKLICNEECDKCNEFFDKNIERDFINYHNLFRITYKIKNKKNEIPKMKKKNEYYISYDEENDLNIAVVESKIIKKSENGLPEEVILSTNEKITVQNIYKALVKFALSVIDYKYIKNFKETIKWLKNEKKVTILPKVILAHFPYQNIKEPEIILYIRKNNNTNIPFLIGEFAFASLRYVFIIPFSNKDEKQFLSESEYNDFLNSFKHIKNVIEQRKDLIQFIDLSDNFARPLQYKIKFEQRKK